MEDFTKDFTDVAQKWFAFLVENESFKCQVEGERRLVYSSPLVVIRLGCGERGDVGMTLDKTSGSLYLPFALYLKIFHPNEHAKLGDEVARSRMELEISVMKLANLLKHFGRPIIEGDSTTFRRMMDEPLD